MSAPYPLRRWLPATLLTTLVLAACGARASLDETVVDQITPNEGGTDASELETSVDASGDGNTSESGTDSGRPAFDGGPIVNCGTCVAQSCGQQLLTCIESTTCRTALQCVVTTCLTGGTPDPSCAEGCANGDITVLGQLIGAFTCILET